MPLLLLVGTTATSLAQETVALQRKGRAPIQVAEDAPIGSKSGPNDVRMKIVNGAPAPKYKFVVGISYTERGKPSICTGLIVASDLVLTAAHCACGDRGSYRVTQDMHMSAGKFIPVANEPIAFDPRICQAGRIVPGYDLAVLRLSQKAAGLELGYKPYIPLAAKFRDRVSYASLLTVIGYGLNEKQAWGVRLEANVPVYSSKCLQWQLIVGGCAPFLELVLADHWSPAPKRTDTCGGDSGGPAFMFVPETHNGTNENMIPALVGITSRSAPLTQVDAESHCGGGGIYTVVGRTDVRGWLKLMGADLFDGTKAEPPPRIGQIPPWSNNN